MFSQLAANGANDIVLSLDVSQTITNPESLTLYIEAQSGMPFGAMQQVLKWDAPTQRFLAWSHEFGFGDSFPLALGDAVFLLTSGGPTSSTFTAHRPNPGEVSFALTPGQPSPDCALNFLSLPLDHPEIANADQLSDAIGTPSPPGPPSVLQALDWEPSFQLFFSWSNQSNFGDLFPTTIGYPYIVCLSDDAPPGWP
jgi:hypothetical protein